jgi:hypothetical protein
MAGKRVMNLQRIKSVPGTAIYTCLPHPPVPMEESDFVNQLADSAHGVMVNMVSGQQFLTAYGPYELGSEEKFIVLDVKEEKINV